MIDPLGSFDWSTLYARYDEKCQRFEQSVKYLNVFSPRPKSDRALYYILTGHLDRGKSGWRVINLSIYEAMIYWKLYSQPAAIKNVLERARSSKTKPHWENEIKRISSYLPKLMSRDVGSIMTLIKGIDEYPLFGMKSSDALPVRTTFLHFLYPAVVPIFDKMVLRAVGVEQKNANKCCSYLRLYIQHVWELADRYSSCFPSYAKETPIRLIEMALWVERG